MLVVSLNRTIHLHGADQDAGERSLLYLLPVDDGSVAADPATCNGVSAAPSGYPGLRAQDSGLSIPCGFVTQHSRKILVERVSDEGSTIKVELPPYGRQSWGATTESEGTKGRIAEQQVDG